MIPVPKMYRCVRRGVAAFVPEDEIGKVMMKSMGGGAFSNAKTPLKFLPNDKNVDVVISGMMRAKEVEANIAIASDSYVLSHEELTLMERSREALGSEYCRNCDYCQPCRQRIPISFVLRAETQSLKRMEWLADHENLFTKARAQVPKCTQCGECESRCPSPLSIRELLPVKLKSLEKRLEKRDF